MPLYLTQTHIVRLGPTTWCATAHVNALAHKHINKPPYLSRYDLNTHIDDTQQWQYCREAADISAPDRAQQQRQLQRQGVRLLLQQLLTKLQIDDTLDESAFPYQLARSKYYVCFSHTGAKNTDDTDNSNTQPTSFLDNQVAVILSQHRPAGIDIEANEVAWQVVRRFYADKEKAVLQRLPAWQRDAIAKRLWQIKESYIKVYQYTLAQGLGVDYAYLIEDLIDSVIDDHHLMTVMDKKTGYRIAIIPRQHIVIVF